MPGPRSLRDFLSGLPESELEVFLDKLSQNAILALPWLFEHWAISGHQLPPEGDWITWVVLGGRGAGKTRAGSEWIRRQVEGARPMDPGACSRVALIGETLDEAREVMVFGESGIMKCSPPDRRPTWNSGRRQLTWPNGASAQIFSASDPEALRGPQFDCAWCDELAKWRKAHETWDMLQFGLRLGSRPRQIVTTTPRNSSLLKTLLEEDSTVMTHAPTSANSMHLASGFLESVTRKYGNSRLGRQELEGELLMDHDGALWTHDTLEAAKQLPEKDLSRIVVAVDPPVTSGERSDECGIIVAGVNRDGSPQDWTAEIILDGSLSGASPMSWATKAVDLYHQFRADRLIAEVNQGGDLVSTLIRQVDGTVAFRAVRASQGKTARAEPVAALYEQNRVRHRRQFPQLEDQLVAMTLEGYQGRGSPDRADALVWAITDLMIDPSVAYRNPKIRRL